MAGVFDHLHIKRHTAGSSNELSFDVLDAARTGLDIKQQRGRRAPKAPKPNQGSYHGVAGTATFSGLPEVEKRKRARRAQSIRVAVASVFVVVAAAFALLWFGYRHYLEVQDFSARFGALVAQLESEDAFVSQVDALMLDPTDQASRQQRQDAAAQIDEAEASIRNVGERAASLEPLVVTSADATALTQVAETAEARVAMLEAASGAFQQEERCRARVEEANAIWEKVVSRGQEARQAAAQANKAASEQAIEEARKAAESLAHALRAVQAELAAFEKKEPGVALPDQERYIEAKAKSLDLAAQTSDALLAGDRAAAASKNDEYNEADRAAAELASALPPSMEAAVKAAYEADLQRYREQYDQARNRAIAADALIREYAK